MLEKRTTGWWGGRFSYTLSRAEDNQFGQASTFQTRTAAPQNNYDLDAEYGISNFDSPHRIILAPIMKFPNSGKGGIAGLFLDGWNASAVVELVSGSPLNAVMSAGTSESNLGLFGGRQRPNAVGDPNTDGSDTDRVVYEGNEDARYFDSAAFANPGVGTYGDAPRTDGDARYQFRKNVDLVIAKDTTLVRQPRRADPVRDPEPDQHGQVPRRRQQRRSTRPTSGRSRSRPGSCGSGSSASATRSDARPAASG